MPTFKVDGKYYTRIRWGNDKTGRGEVKFPLCTDQKSVAEFRRDTIQDTSLRQTIIDAYDEYGTSGVDRIKEQIDWYKKGGTLIESGYSFSQAVLDYKEYLVSQRIKDSTINLYMEALNKFTASAKVKQVKNVKQKHFTAFKKSMSELRSHTVNRKLRSLQTFFNWLNDEGQIKHPIKIKKITALQRPVRFFSNHEFELILKNVRRGFPHQEAKIKEEDRDLFIRSYRLYRDTGMRLSEPFDNELLMDGNSYRLRIIGSSTKNSYQRFVHLTEQQAMIIIQMNEWLELQLKRRKDRYGVIKVFSRVFAKSLKKANLKGKLHDLRKTFASRLWFLTGQEFALCNALGHTDTSMTKQYTALDKVELANAFPDIAEMRKKGIIEDKTPLRVPNQGDIELYSNFGFLSKKS